MSIEPLGRGKTLPQVGATVDRLVGAVNRDSVSPASEGAGLVVTDVFGAIIQGEGPATSQLPFVHATVTARQQQGGAAATDSTVVPGGTRVEYKVTLYGTEIESDWMFAANDDLRELPRYPAPDKAKAVVWRWPDDTGVVRAVLQLIDTEHGRGKTCTAPA